MSIPRYSREDMAQQMRRIKGFAEEEGPGETVDVHRDVLRMTAAMLSQAANHTPTHAELVAQIEMLRAYEEAERLADGRCAQPSTPSEDL